MSVLLGIGNALQKGVDTFGEFSERRRLRQRQQEQDAIQKLLLESQMKNISEDNARAGRAEERLVRNERRDTAKDTLLNLPGKTNVSSTPSVMKEIEEFFPSFLSQETLPAKSQALPTGIGLTQSQDLSNTETFAQPMVPPALKAAQEATERQIANILATQGRHDEMMTHRENVLTQREHEANDRNAYRGDVIDIRQKLAEISGVRADDASTQTNARLRIAFERLVESEAKERFPDELGGITGEMDPKIAAAREDYKRKRLAELLGEDVSTSRVSLGGSPIVLDPQNPAASDNLVVGDKASAAAELIRRRGAK